MSTFDAKRSDGHELARLQIEKHGRDRYPEPTAQVEKLLTETVELLGALITHKEAESHWDHLASECPLIRMELADAGLSLYGAANKVGIDLIEAMTELVERDGRRFP